SSVVGLHKDWCSWLNKARPRAEAGETIGITARLPCATAVLLDVLHMATTRKIIAALSRKKL
ncbi:hypothetical protein A2U01_0114213, partial [Trifolium medium]|nr:hypothetical protein [Trifolium medium]